MQFSHEICNEWNENSCNECASHGSLDCLKFCHENGASWNNLTCYFAAKNGNIECIRYLYYSNCPDIKCSMGIDTAALYGNLECLKFLFENGSIPGNRLCDNAAKGNIECIKYLLDKGLEITENTLGILIKNGHIEYSKYLIKQGSKINQNAMISAVGNNDIEFVKLLLNHGGTFNIKMYEAAISSGALNMIKFLYENKCPYDSSIIECAMKNNQYDIFTYIVDVCVKDGMILSSNLTVHASSLKYLKYLHEHGCPLHTNIFNGKCIECIQYAYENGLRVSNNGEASPPENSTLSWIKCGLLRSLDKNKYIVPKTEEIFDYFRNNNVYLSNDGLISCFTIAIENNSLSFLEKIIQCGIKLNDIYFDPKWLENIECLKLIYKLESTLPISVLKMAIRNNNDTAFNFYIENIFVNDPDACENASHHGKIHYLKLLHEKGWPWDKHTLDSAIKKDNSEIFLYALHNGCQPDSSLYIRASEYNKLSFIKYLQEFGLPITKETFDKMMKYALTYKNGQVLPYLQNLTKNFI